MSRGAHAIAVLVGAGSGTRLGAELPKAFVTIQGKTLLERSLLTLFQSECFTHVVSVVPQGWESRAQELVGSVAAAQSFAQNSTPHCSVCTGAASRHDSVLQGVHFLESRQLLSTNTVLAVHDAARCLVSVSVIQGAVEAAAAHGASAAAVLMTDTLKRVSNPSQVSRYPFIGGTRALAAAASVERDGMYAMQTPQCVQWNILRMAIEQRDPTRQYTDEVSLISDTHPVVLVPGDEQNIKVTTPADLQRAEQILSLREHLARLSDTAKSCG